jgi:hypothetical protein
MAAGATHFLAGQPMAEFAVMFAAGGASEGKRHPADLSGGLSALRSSFILLIPACNVTNPIVAERTLAPFNWPT